MHNSVDFSKNFQAIIKQKGLSQLEIAEKSGIHKQTINRYVNGKTDPRWSELVKLADVLNCTLDSFLVGECCERTQVATQPDDRIEQMKPIIKELGSVVNRLTSFISD